MSTAYRLSVLGLSALLLLVACGTVPEAAVTESAPAASSGVLQINTSPDQKRIRAAKVESIAAQVPAEIRAKGEFLVGTTTFNPPLSFLADDNVTPIGVEEDIASLVADVLGLKLRIEPTSWENLFLAVRSGKYAAGFSNITVTEERKDVYDFATYRLDQLAWEVPKDSTITAITKPADVAGLSVAVGSGTNQEKILLGWDKQNRDAGLKPVQIQYYSQPADTYLALKSGRIQAYFGPNPTLAYHAAVSGDTKIVGTFSGAGPTLQGLIAAMTQKGNGLAKPISEAINSLIKDGTYGKVLARWGLSTEAVPESLVNPPGLPREQ
ncbi:putative amino acid ABC transporter, substrate-binding protein [Microbispora rosea subsp. aerata]|nr:ABC transporter substrate-binding protein [Microbispora rosea]GGO22834.1 putative amino acid ABC transporter, substrate-binding protein [Microbispora rosea subsp. aerata]GIH58286.1 putative amino acid ABC transporter, substrate-binding protein [Microbispora rosea subsp. aerata]GLJ82173.1 putative amino acid ABC transporter, substrate-binding protein [Microbispora rosea subsp. aerata]